MSGKGSWRRPYDSRAFDVGWDRAFRAGGGAAMSRADDEPLSDFDLSSTPLSENDIERLVADARASTEADARWLNDFAERLTAYPTLLRWIYNRSDIQRLRAIAGRLGWK